MTLTEAIASASEELSAMVGTVLLSLTQHNIPPDVQELLMYGSPQHGIAPGALYHAIATLRAQYPEKFQKDTTHDK